MLECKAVTKIYGERENRVMALQGISFSVDPGTFLCIMGRSGSGKTTLLNCLGALDQPTAGEIYLDGEVVHPRLRRKIGFVFQEPCLFPYLSALDNVALPLVYRGLSWKVSRAQAGPFLAQAGLSHRMRHPARGLSGGEAQRVAVARALVVKPGLLLADEPTAELDTSSSANLIRLLLSVKQEGGTLIVATHDPAVEKLADRTLHMEDGRIAVK